LNRVRAASRVVRFLITALEAVGGARIARDQSVAARAERLHHACTEIACHHGLQLSMRGRVCLPTGPAILVANHVSYLDVIAIAAVQGCVPIAKSELAGWPVIGNATRGLGGIFVERASPWGRVRALRRALAVLQAGVPVLNFPEGTTTDGRQLLPFHRGIFGLARIANVPVVPIAIRCSRALAWHGNAPFLPHYLRTTQTDPQICLELGAPLDPRLFASADELAVVAHHRIAHMLRDQLEPHATITRLRVPAPRADAVLPAREHQLAQ
jgi:lyso-ornithine lipid O-acyltransferase